jgi:hypothetical protein
MTSALIFCWIVATFAYWLGYRFRRFSALSLLAIVGLWSLSFIVTSSILRHDSDAGISLWALARCAFIALFISAFPLYLLVGREGRGNANESMRAIAGCSEGPLHITKIRPLQITRAFQRWLILFLLGRRRA